MIQPEVSRLRQQENASLRPERSISPHDGLSEDFPGGITFPLVSDDSAALPPDEFQFPTYSECAS